MMKTLAFTWILAGLAASSPAQQLFAPVYGGTLVTPVSPGVVRSREVRVRLDRIPGATVRDAARGLLPPPRHRLVLNLFDDVVVRRG